VFGLLKDNILRLFRIDIEAESTITGDESREKQDRTQLIESATKFMEAWGPMVAQKPDLAPLAGALLTFGVRAFRVGRELEQVIEETVDKFEQQAKAGGGGKPDPKAAAEQIKLQGMQVKAQAEIQKAQIDAQTSQMENQAKVVQIQLKAQSDERKAVLDAQKGDLQHRQNVVEIGAQALADHHARQHQAGMDQSLGVQQAAHEHHARAHQSTLDQMQMNQQAQNEMAVAKQQKANQSSGE